MKKLAIIFLFASSLGAQVQIGKNVQIGAGGTSSGFVTSLTTVGNSGNASVTAGVLNIPNYTFSFTLGATPITNGSTVTSVTGLSVNGVTLNGAGSSSLFLNQAGGYTAPASGAISSVSNSDGTLTISPTTGAVVASLNLANPNTWTAPVSVAVAGGQGGTFDGTEGTAATATAGHDVLYADSASHCIKYSANGGSFACIGSGGSGSSLPALVAQPTPSSTTFLQALNNAKNTAVEVKVMGDSFVRSCQPQGAGTGNGPNVCTNRWAEQLRIQLQAIYGSNGTGVVPVQVGMSGATVTPDNTAWSCTGTVATSNLLGPTQGSGNTLIALSPGASCTFHDTRNIAWDTLNTLCMTNATSVGIAVNIDSGAATGTACGTTTGSATAKIVTLASTSSTGHSVTFTNTAGSGTAYLYGARGVSGTTGVSVSNEAFDGATAALYGASATAEMAFSDLIPHQALIYMDQTNDAAGGVSTGTFSTNVQNIINHEQALASSPTVVLAIPPVDVVNGSFPLAPYTAIQTGLCTANALTCVNIQSRGTTVGSTAVGWGTTYISSPLWDLTGAAWPTGNAGVHPSDAGSLDEFQMIYAALVNPVCTINCVFSQSTTVQSGSSSISQNAIGTTNTASTNYVVPGMSTITMGGWGTGNGAGLVGVWGPLDNNTLKFIWNTNLTDDICGYTPITNVSTCSGSTWTINHTGAATFPTINGTTIPTSATLTQTIASGTSALGTSAIASGACATVVTTTATGTASTDAIIWNPNGSIKAVTGYVPATTGGLTIAAYPTTNNVNFDVCNWTASSITPGAVTINWRVTR